MSAPGVTIPWGRPTDLAWEIAFWPTLAGALGALYLHYGKAQYSGPTLVVAAASFYIVVLLVVGAMHALLYTRTVALSNTGLKFHSLQRWEYFVSWDNMILEPHGLMEFGIVSLDVRSQSGHILRGIVKVSPEQARAILTYPAGPARHLSRRQIRALGLPRNWNEQALGSRTRSE
jgi:hypothetical protein